MFITSCETMRQLDAETIKNYGVPGIVLMENAGRGAAEVILNEKPELNSALIVCGKGNNGGDGFVIGRHLQNRGVKTKVLLLGEEKVVCGDAKVNLEAYKKCGGKIIEVTTKEILKKCHHSFHHTEVIVDAIFGTGFKGEVEGLYSDVIGYINASKALTVAVDIPSGMNADKSATCETAVIADQTVTFGCYKPAHCLYPAAEQCGEVSLVDISIPAKLIQEKYEGILVTDDIITREERGINAHKGDFGTLLVIAGSHQMGGAAILAAKAAIRSGVGLCNVVLPEGLNNMFKSAVPEAITTPLRENREGRLAFSDISDISHEELKASAILIGPGLGLDEDTEQLVYDVLENFSDIPVIVDADGLNALAKNPAVLAGRDWNTVLTPHIGEFQRLSGLNKQEIIENKFTAVKEFAYKHNAVTLLKGPGTFIAGATTAYVNSTGNSGMAMAGSGDVLSGIIGTLLARGYSTDEAAYTGAYIHGLAGDICREEIGEFGFTPSDMIEALPTAFKG